MIRRRYLDGRFGQIHLREAGEGKPLLLVHMAPLGADMYTELVPFLAANRRVIAPDLPGYGMSDRPGKLPSAEDFATSLIDILDGLGIGRAALFGHHAGSIIALQCAALAPDRVSALSLSCLPNYSPEQAEEERLRRVPRMFKHDGSTLASLWGSTSIEGVPVTDRDRDFSLRMMVLQLQTAEHWYYLPRAVLTPNVPLLLSGLGCPVQLLYPEHDRFSADQSKLAAGARHAELRMLSGDGPGVIWREPSKYAGPLLDFLDRVDA